MAVRRLLVPSERNPTLARLQNAVVRSCLLRLSKCLDCADDQDDHDDSGEDARDTSEDAGRASDTDRHTDCKAEQDRECRAEDEAAAIDESKRGARRGNYTLRAGVCQAHD
jgi:hypothetical protein